MQKKLQMTPTAVTKRKSLGGLPPFCHSLWNFAFEFSENVPILHGFIAEWKRLTSVLARKQETVSKVHM